MVVCDPPDANEHKTQYIAEKFWRHRQQAVFQSGGNILVLHLGNVNFQYEKSNDDREDSIAECLDPRSRHLTDSKNSEKPFVQIFLVFSQRWFGQCYGVKKLFPSQQIEREIFCRLCDPHSGNRDEAVL